MIRFVLVITRVLQCSGGQRGSDESPQAHLQPVEEETKSIKLIVNSKYHMEILNNIAPCAPCQVNFPNNVNGSLISLWLHSYGPTLWHSNGLLKLKTKSRKVVWRLARYVGLYCFISFDFSINYKEKSCWNIWTKK